MKAVGFSRETAERILQAVDAVEAAPTRLATEPGRRASIDVYHVQLTSLTTVSGRYPGKRYTYDPSSSTWTAHDDVWVIEANGTALALSTKYPAYRNAVANGRPVWVVSVAAGVASINGDTAAAQILTVGTSGTDFAIDDSTPGTHKFNLPDASASGWALDTTPGGSQDVSGADSRGAVNKGDQIFYGNKGCTEDHYAAKYVGESLTSPRNWTSGFDQSNPWSPGHAAVTVLNSKSGSVWAATAGLSAIGSVDVDGTTSCVDVTFMVNIASDEAEYVYDAGFTGTIAGLSSPTSSAKTWSPRYKYLSGFTALNIPTYENGFTGSALGKTWIGGHMVGSGAPTTPQSEGGTGLDTSGVTDGQILIGKTSDHSWNLATLTAGSGITITDGGGTITIAATGGGGGAPDSADYLVKTANGSLSAERVVTDSTPITWDWSTSGQVKALIAGATTLYGSFDKLTVKGSNVASASTTDLSTATGVYVYVTGNTTIDKFGDAPAGTVRLVRFTSNPTIVHSSYITCIGGASITAATDDTCVLVCEGGSPAIWSMHAYTKFDGTAISGASAPKFALYQHQLTSGTNGGTTTAGAWYTVPLNTEVYDAGGIGSLSSNQVTLGAGNYYFRGVSPIGQNSRMIQLRLYNATDSSVIQLGVNGYDHLAGGTATPSEVEGYFTLSGTKAIELQYRVYAGAATYGLGIAASWGTEIYGTLNITKF